MATEQTNRRDRRFFSVLYRTRFKVSKNGETVVNLSILFSLISLLTAPWLVFFGLLAALIMGYRFAVDRDGLAFEQNFDNVVKDAAANVKHAVESISEPR